MLFLVLELVVMAVLFDNIFTFTAGVIDIR